MERVILFDMDGVLVNTELLHYRIWKQILAEHGVDLTFEVYKGCVGANGHRLLELVQEHHGLSLFHREQELNDSYRRLKDENLVSGDIPRIEKVAETLATLRQRGWRMAVASSSHQAYIEGCTDKVGIGHFFDVRFSAENVKNTKPAPDVFLAAAAAMGAAPEECVVVEDSRNGTLAAKAAGMCCIGFVNPDSGDQDLSAATTLIHHFSELTDVL